jgi:outer membrane protein OmpA-like peptidoglycan-associated protein
MLKLITVSITLGTILATNIGMAETLSFPQTKEEWIRALSSNPKPQSKKPTTRALVFGNSAATQTTNPVPAMNTASTESCSRAGVLIQFDYNSAVLRADINPALDALGEALRTELTSLVLRVEGHTDNTGSENYNLDLSTRRATTVRDYLATKYGIDKQRLPVEGYGKSRPIGDNSTDAGRALNRRVEFVNVCQSK